MRLAGSCCEIGTRSSSMSASTSVRSSASGRCWRALVACKGEAICSSELSVPSSGVTLAVRIGHARGGLHHLHRPHGAH